MKKKLIDSYTVIADNVPAKVNIYSTPESSVPIYEVTMPELGDGTSALMNILVDELAEKVPLDVEEVTNPQKLKQLKQKFSLDAGAVVKKHLPDYPKEKVMALAGMLLQRMYGLGDVEIIMADNFLEEIAINTSREPISVYHKKHGWCKTTKRLHSEEEIFNFSAQIGRKVGREINTLNPIMDAHLLTGDRVAATIFPISTRGNTITIRKFARAPWTVTNFLDPEINTFSKEIAAFLWLAIQYELNVLVAGGTASGKTSVLNALCSFIPPTQHIISIEDTREIALPKELYWNWVPLTSRKAQAESLFEAMHTGHSVYVTMHADTVEQVKKRLIEPPMEIPKGEVGALHLVLVQYRDRRKGLRRTLEMAEILARGREGLELNYLYRWHPRKDVFEKISNSIRVFEELNLHTGMTLGEIQEDLKSKQNILQWMVDNKIYDIDQVGDIMRIYYKNPDELINAALKKQKASSLLGG